MWKAQREVLSCAFQDITPLSTAFTEQFSIRAMPGKRLHGQQFHANLFLHSLYCPEAACVELGFWPLKAHVRFILLEVLVCSIAHKSFKASYAWHLKGMLIFLIGLGASVDELMQ
jgi:hypothetical protein